MEHNTRLKLGSTFLHFWNTPGHTIESICIMVTIPPSLNLLKDSSIEKYNPKAIFTGDTVFIGDVGRPDLAATEDGTLTSKHLAEMMFNSVQKLKQIPDDVVMFPGHGAGSACGKNISNALFCTMGKQKTTNYAFLEENKEEFIKKLIQDLPQPPDYFGFNVELNKNSFKKNVEEIISKNNLSISPKDFNKMVESNNYIVLDCRSKTDFEKSHIPGSLLSPLSSKFAIFAANIIAKPQLSLILVIPEGKSEECIRRLARTGIENVEGYLSDFEQYKNEGFHLETVSEISADELFEDYSNESPQMNIIDVRGIGEWKTGHINTATLVPMPTIKDTIANQCSNKNSHIAVHCMGGLRSLVCYAYLKSQGYTNVRNVTGGYKALIQKDFQIKTG